MGLAAELAGELGALGDGAQGVLVELSVLVKYVNEDVAHTSSFLSSSQAMICSTVSLVSSSSMIWPASFWGGSWKLPQSTCEPSAPTLPASLLASPTAMTAGSSTSTVS